MEKIMTPEQAIKLLSEVVAQVSMPKQGHINCEVALNVLAKLIPKPETCKKESE